MNAQTKTSHMKNPVRYLLLGFLVAYMIVPVMKLPGATTKTNPFIDYHEFFRLDTLTVYNPVRSQCDADPFITASNKKINEEKLRAGDIRWMALSRDMLKRWGGSLHYGDTVSVAVGDSTIDGAWIIQDTMNKRFRKRGDLLFDTKVRSRGRWTNVKVSKKSRLYPIDLSPDQRMASDQNSSH